MAVKKPKWNLFEENLIVWESIFDDGFVGVRMLSGITKNQDGKHYTCWSADYEINVGMSSYPGSGFGDYPMDGEFEYDEKENVWKLREKDRVNKFRLPTKKELNKYKSVMQYIPSLSELQERR